MGLFRLLRWVLPDALLSVRSAVVSSPHHTLFKANYIQGTVCPITHKAYGWEEKNKKNVRWEIFSWGGEKKHSLKKLVCVVAFAFFKSVSFCVVAFGVCFVSYKNSSKKNINPCLNFEKAKTKNETPFPINTFSSKK